MSDTRSPSSPFPSSLVAGLTKKPLEEGRSEVMVALDGVLAYIDTVPGYKTRWLA